MMKLERPEPVLDDKYTNPIVLGDFYVCVINDKKYTSLIISTLGELRPLKEFSYLKRVKTISNQEKSLQVLLCYKEDIINTKDISIESILGPDSVITPYLSKPVLVKVPICPPLTKHQYKEAFLYWPSTFHEDKQITRLLSGSYFTQSEVDQINKNMLEAVKMAKIAQCQNQLPIGAVIVDPSDNTIIAKCHDLRKGDYPLQHATMNCIDLVATSQGGGMWSLTDDEFYYSKDIKSTSKDDKTGPYLCTGYDLYVTQEPCIMCSMALVHSRIRCVFYGSMNKEGALGSQYKVHTQSGLNHHYQVFKHVLLTDCQLLHQHPP